jgi:hypothetical protein
MGVLPVIATLRWTYDRSRHGARVSGQWHTPPKGGLLTHHDRRDGRSGPALANLRPSFPQTSDPEILVKP